ncbi:hypothetical protein TRAPUB_10925 [Trametes pubescens]|uniref:Uncharacterized protein n=1 Tax=Trametes pubescens TaxID=154538 RepID=A0A1M2VY41_TRAPU|nr:hypothetical protein TRAPUB_10925 [Trametes pubescens]
MFSRVLTRNFFFRRGQQADGSAKHNKAAPRSRSASPERRDTKNVLQPSSQHVIAGDNAQIDAPQVNNEELASKPSAQSMNERVDEYDENSPARFKPYVDPDSRTETSLGDVDQSLVFRGCDHSLTPSVQDTTTSFILVNTSDNAVKPVEQDDESDDGEEQTFETPQLGSSQSEDMSLASVVNAAHKAVETPSLGSSAFGEALFPEPAAITVRLPPPSLIAEHVDVASEAVNSPVPDQTPSVSADDLSFEHEEAFLDMGPISLPTGLLSDITEEPSLSELSCKSPAIGSLGVPADAHKADLSFSSFGSSYANTHSADTSVVLPSEPRSTPTTPTRFQEVMQNILAEAVASRSPNWGGADVSNGLILPPPSIPPSLSTPATLGDIDHACSPVAGSTCTASVEDLPPPSGTLLSVSSPGMLQQDDAIIASTGGKAVVKLPDIPAPSTYADAMNLALQYPEMSKRLLQEPLASSSNCPTPAGSTAIPAPKKAAVSAPTRAAAAPADGKTKKNKGPAHSKERPNWARAIEDLKADIQQRPRGRSITVASTCIRDGPRNERPSNGEPTKDETPTSVPTSSAQPLADTSRPLQPSSQTGPVAINARSSQVKPVVPTKPPPSDASLEEPPVPGKGDSQSQSPEKRPVGLSKSSLKRERVAVWLPRVRSWVQQTSSVDQASPSAHNTPAGSLETSPAMAPLESSVPEVQPALTTQAHPLSSPEEQHVPSDAPAGDAKAPTVPRTTPTTSPLNPLAPVWEFKPHQRATTATFVQQPSHGTPFMNPPTAPASYSPLPHGIEADLERLRVMLHDSGLEDRRLSAAQSHQHRSIWGSPEHAQAAVHTNTVPHNIVVPMHARQNFQGPSAPQTNFAAPPVNAGRQRTQTHIPLSQRASWQGVPSRPGLTAPEQLASARGAPGFVSTANLPPPVPYLSMTMSGLSPLSQMASRAALDAQPVGPRPPGAPHNAHASLPPATRTRSGSVSLPMSQAVQFANAGRHPSRSPGDVYYSGSPPAPPGSGRPWPPANVPAAAPNTRFYGIETPLVVFDKHGWTVNNQ